MGKEVYCFKRIDMIQTAGITVNNFSNDFIVQKAAYHHYRQAYINLIDGGDSPGVLDEITNATDRPTLETSLSSLASNLSREALQATIERMTLLKDTGVYYVLRGNAEAVNETILEQFNDKALAVYNGHWFREWMIDSIRVRMDSLTYRTFLLDTLSYHSEAKEKMAFKVLSLIIEDSSGIDLDSYRLWLDSVGGFWAKREMVNTYVHEGRLDTLTDVLASAASLITETEDSINFANFTDYVLGYANWITEDSSIMKLPLEHVLDLNEIALANQHLIGSMYARNMLNYFYDSTYFTQPHLPYDAPVYVGKRGNEDEDHLISPEGKNDNPKDVFSLKIYPNPTRDFVTVEYDGFEENSKIELLDIFGRVVSEGKASESDTKVILDTRVLMNGMYLVKISSSAGLLDRGRFNILK